MTTGKGRYMSGAYIARLALKTFVQAFFGVLVPEIAAILQVGFPENWPAFWALIAAPLAAALAAGISAVWNRLFHYLDPEDVPEAA